MLSDPDAITRLYRACDPSESLRPDDPRYVDCNDVRGGEDVARLFARDLRRADPARPAVKLFAGHRGVGKTSELFRLKAMIEAPASTTGVRPFRVVYFDVSDVLDVNDLDFPDLLIAIAAQVEENLRAVDGLRAASAYLAERCDELKAALTQHVSLPSFSLAGLTLELRNRPSQRRILREQIEHQSTSMLAAVNDLLVQANMALRRSDREGLVLIVDGLDKLVRRSLGEGTNTHDRLFIHRAEQLAALKTHVIYTMPISLFYSPLCAVLEQTCGEILVPVSMIRLRSDRKGKVACDTAGMQRLRDVLDRRCRHASLSFAEAFQVDAADYLCEMSGGHPRHLMTFVRAATTLLDALPITLATAQRAVDNYGNSLLRELSHDAWELLRRFDEPQDEIPKDERHQEMLFLLHVFEYMNGRPWYEVNPVLRTLPQFQRAG